MSGGPSRFAAAVVVIGDATIPINCAKGGVILELIGYLNGRLRVTRDVLTELEGLRAEFPAIEPFIDWLEADETNRVAALSPEGLQRAGDLARNFQLPGDHPRKHLGECTTVVAGEELRAKGVDPLLGLDDSDGRRLAIGSRFTIGNSAELIIEMVCHGGLPPAHGGRAWRSGVYPGRREMWKVCAERLRQLGIGPTK
jgi:hypothetical protein